MQSVNLWTALGKPRTYVEFDNMRYDKFRYKRAIKKQMKKVIQINSQTALMSHCYRKILDSSWNSWRSKFGKQYRLLLLRICGVAVSILS